MSPFIVVIPARYGSTRLPAKALADIDGRPMIQWVIAAALLSRAQEVIVATDDARVAVAAAIDDPRASVVMTRADHPSGTDRIAEVAAMRGWWDTDLVVNVQGDEPQLPPQLIDQVADMLASDTRADIATLSTPISSVAEFLDPNAVKVVVGSDRSALYFSRAPIPWNRDGTTRVSSIGEMASQTTLAGAQRHLGIYAYRVASLRRITSLPPSTLELTEKLEQLRALQAGMRIVVAEAAVVPGSGVDTEHDLARVRAAVAAGKSS
jgi:3-deoxy-manno-octulosonate cytidylyltransferase (CMP-KDO synthetase)